MLSALWSDRSVPAKMIVEVVLMPTLCLEHRKKSYLWHRCTLLRAIRPPRSWLALCFSVVWRTT